MGSTKNLLDLERVRQLFDLAGSFHVLAGGNYTADPYVAWNRLREEAPLHRGTVHGLSGVEEELYFHGLPYEGCEHFSAFTWRICDALYRNPDVFASSFDPVDLENGPVSALNSLLSMGGSQHRRYRSLVQPSFSPAKASWWIQNWIEATVHALIDSFENEHRAELNVEFCAAIPVLTITGSFGVPVDQALDLRASLNQPDVLVSMIAPIVAARREQPEDDLISVLVEAEIKDEGGHTQRLSDAEIYSFAALLLTAGSGTTWKQMGITLAALLQRPEQLESIKGDRELLRAGIEESLRWMPTDPMFSRFVLEDTELEGFPLKAGSVVHICLGAANRDPARWDNPDDFDISRSLKPTLAFGSGPHVCLGQHVARFEMTVAINALLDRLPNLRLDPEAEVPQFIGFYERGATAIPVIFD